MKIFLDANILMDVLLTRQPFCLYAARLLELCAEGRLDGHVFTITFPTLAYILRKGHTPEYVRRKLQVLTDIVLRAEREGRSPERPFARSRKQLLLHPPRENKPLTCGDGRRRGRTGVRPSRCDRLRVRANNYCCNRRAETSL